ncbi:GMC family oxidoreductase [Aspergillus stella-maris]|uniref:GMC family oxidoreductase n=1 Tax=Aspergillus stella-maris TaxID=1810926 RepID=UPI003CCD0A2A
MDEEYEYDIIFAGGGTAACVAAGRLSQRFPDFKILIIERGRDSLGDPTVEHPALFMAHLMPDSTTALFYRSKAADDVGGREVVIPAGGMLGGGSAINLSMYTRAQAFDYDSWETPGWTAQDMIPLCNQVETYHADPGLQELDPGTHGSSGPIHISDGGFRPESTQVVMDTIAIMGMKELEDINDFQSVGGFMKIPRYVSLNGKRSDAAHGYINPLRPTSKNLYLLLESTVTRILFDENSTPPRASGVEYRSTHNPKGSFHSARARHCVVLSSGALGSPQILERSGVGSKDLLKRLGIPIISDLLGVGENYQDHHLVTSSYKTTLCPEETLDSLATGHKNVGEAIATKDPQLGSNTIDIAGKIRPNDEEARSLGPTFYDRWQKDWVPRPNKPMILMNFINAFVGNPADVDPNTQHLTIGCISLYPYSRGSIHIANTTGDYDLETGFLEDPVDVKKQVWGYKRAREIARRLPFSAGEVEATHPRYPIGSSAAIVSSADAEDEIIYSAEDDGAIDTWIRQTVGTTWHSLGTCAMKPLQDRGVVNERLDVYGTRGLKVADLSIAPGNIGGNVGNTAFAIGEKAALILADELDCL